MLKKNDRPAGRRLALRAWAPCGLAALMLSGLRISVAAPNDPCYPWTATVSSGESDLKGYTAEAVCLEIAERKTSYSWAHGPKVTTYTYFGLLPSGPDGFLCSTSAVTIDLRTGDVVPEDTGQRNLDGVVPSCKPLVHDDRTCGIGNPAWPDLGRE
jgi:hypothetical protein